MNRKQREETSKFLSYVLRHEPQAIGIQLDSQGWVEIDALIHGAARHGRLLQRDDILETVASNEKQRFAVSADGSRIRASQGHSTMSVAIEHEAKEPPALLYHGTASRFLDSIRLGGLIAGSRHHVHLSHEQHTAIDVGRRHGSPAVLEVDAAGMYRQGFRFFQADNGVWLTEQVPVEFLTRLDATEAV
ncbi:MAG TPA: RNA 2'-phosphotransferase [Pseudomonas sp.]|nr:RNA 2'-phosphotransferase [Pseudomonas sp.]